ncbi:uncharacterized transporter slc-17.2-like isoform X2 [Ruditapes philippinarum]|nr:uncharacterized transporter slc-17.2-like isoform X2 [Ruditapes philippinarum]
MAMWLSVMAFMLNTNMNFAIVCMVKSKHDIGNHGNRTLHNTYLKIGSENETLDNDLYLNNHNMSLSYSKDDENLTLPLETARSCDTVSSSNSIKRERAEFSWDKKTQSLILSSYYYGYMVMQIPGGLFVSRFGGKLVVCISMLTASILTILMPVFARNSYYVVIAARSVLGLCIGTVNSSIYGLVGTWALPTERSRFLGICWFGNHLGAVIGISTSGLLCVYGFDNGWASIFYIQGTLTLIFVGCWWFLAFSSPNNHPRISSAERNLILKHVPEDTHTDRRKKKTDVPWTSILSYLPVYMVFLCHVCDTWTFYLLVTCLPLFLKEILKFDIESNGLFSCLPYLSYMIGIAVAGVGADLARSWKNTSITTIRKVFQITSFAGVAIFILIPGHLTCEYRYVVITCFSLCTFFEAIGISGGHLPNIVDIAPRYSSLIFAVSNTIATIPGIIAPIAVGEITKSGTSDEWRIVFYIASGVAVFAAIMYGIFGNSELAPWARGANGDLEMEVKLSKEGLTKC